MQFISEALEVKPNDAEALILHGKMYIKEKDGESAASLLTRAQESIDQQGEQAFENAAQLKASVYFYLGQAYELQKDLKRGLYNYKKCL